MKLNVDDRFDDDFIRNSKSIDISKTRKNNKPPSFKINIAELSGTSIPKTANNTTLLKPAERKPTNAKSVTIKQSDKKDSPKKPSSKFIKKVTLTDGDNYLKPSNSYLTKSKKDLQKVELASNPHSTYDIFAISKNEISNMNIPQSIESFYPVYPESASEIISPARRNKRMKTTKNAKFIPQKKLNEYEVDECAYEVSHKTSIYLMDILGRYFDLRNSYDNIYKIDFDLRYIIELSKIAKAFRDQSILEQIKDFLEETISITSFPYILLEIINEYNPPKIEIESTARLKIFEEVLKDLDDIYYGLITKIISMFDSENYTVGFKNFFTCFDEYIFDNKTFDLQKFQILFYIMSKIKFIDYSPPIKVQFFTITYPNLKEGEKEELLIYMGKQLKKDQIKAVNEKIKKIQSKITDGGAANKEKIANTGPLVDSLFDKLEKMQAEVNVLNTKNGDIAKDHKLIKESFESNKTSITEIGKLIKIATFLERYKFINRRDYNLNTKNQLNKHPILCIEKLFYRLNRYLAIGSGNQIFVQNFDNNKNVTIIKAHKAPVTCLLFINDSAKSVLISGSVDTTIKIWNAEDNSFNCINILFGHVDSITCIIFHKKGIIISGGLDKNLRVWNYERADTIFTLSSHDSGVSRLFDLGNNYDNGEANYIVSSGYDSTIKIWNLNTRKCIETLSEHTDAVNCIAYCKRYEQKTIVTASKDSTLKIFRLNYNNNKSLYTLTGHIGEVISVLYLYRCDKNLLISGGIDNTLRVWSVDKGKLFNTFDIGYNLGVSGLYYFPDDNNKFITTTSDGVFSWFTCFYNKDNKEIKEDSGDIKDISTYRDDKEKNQGTGMGKEKNEKDMSIMSKEKKEIGKEQDKVIDKVEDLDISKLDDGDLVINDVNGVVDEGVVIKKEGNQSVVDSKQDIKQEGGEEEIEINTQEKNIKITENIEKTVKKQEENTETKQVENNDENKETQENINKDIKDNNTDNKDLKHENLNNIINNFNNNTTNIIDDVKHIDENDSDDDDDDKSAKESV